MSVPTAARALATAFGDLEAIMAATEQQLADVEGCRPDHRRGLARVVRRGLASSDRAEVAGPPALRLADERDTDIEPDAGRANHRGHRIADRFLPRRGQGGHHRPRRQGSRIGLQENVFRGRRGRAGFEVRQGHRMGVPILDEDGFRRLLAQGPPAAG